MFVFNILFYFFILREYKDKIDIVDNKEEDTIEYDYRNTYIYKPEQNGIGLTGNEIVTVAHPLILAMIYSINGIVIFQILFFIFLKLLFNKNI